MPKQRLILWAVLATAILPALHGCTDNKRATEKITARLEAIESNAEATRERIAALEKQIEKNRASASNLHSLVLRQNLIMQDAQDTLLIALTNAMENMSNQMMVVTSALTSKTTNRPARWTAPVVRQPVKTIQNAGTRDGVPISIYNTIAADAATDWPGDFKMQEFVIKTQIEAYKKLHP